MDDVLQSFFSFSTFIEKLKLIERYKGQFYWKDYPQLERYESVADHSWRLALLVLVVSDRLSQKLAIEKALKMALVHDIAEIIAGDAHPMGSDGTGKDTYYSKKELAEEKYQRERDAAGELFGMLPEKERNSLLSLWLEYEKKDCFEAKVVKALDVIECMLQVLEYRKGYMFRKHQTFTIEYGKRYANVDPFIASLAETIENKMKEQYKEFNK